MQAIYLPKDARDFPERLQVPKLKIEGLWYLGNLAALTGHKMVAIVGSRRMSRYGKQVLAEIVPQLVAAGYVTISGFMYGIDIEMHRLTILHGGMTIGVFGWGIDAPILPENENLYHKVLESDGLFLSELEPTQLGALWTFPQRNRIVVGLSDLVIVVEAGMKSGTLNSTDWARKMGKPVYAVPGSIFSPVSAGCNWLLDLGLAKPFTLDYFKGSSLKIDKNYSKKGAIQQSKAQLTNDESILLTQLRLEGPLSVNELARRLGKSAGEVSAMLTTLFLRGEVQEERGVWMVG